MSKNSRFADLYDIEAMNNRMLQKADRNPHL
jgi:hypothetical protein